MKLAIAIPALNEEASIGAVTEAAIAAQAKITGASPVEQVDIIVVSAANPAGVPPRVERIG
ncbi:MAG TPA: hypothetical protein VLW17_06040 [Thermoanaerobaculaceae bacterium]|nr:hypothetical protein [Thermoanaerobaculaceae bacterium]